MKFFSLEKRPVNPKAVYAACMLGLTIGLPAVMIIPRFIEAREGAQVQAGTPCIYNGEVGKWQILEDRGDTYVLRNYMLGGDNSLTVPKDQVTFSDRWVDESYRWVRWFD